MSAVTDIERVQFMLKLAVQYQKTNGLLLSDWENRFVASFCGASRQTLWFTDARRTSADKMRMKYGREPEIAMPWPSEEATMEQRNRLPGPAKDGCCEYVKRDEEKRQIRCNEPAVFQTGRGFRYCRACAEIAVEACKQAKQHLHLKPI